MQGASEDDTASRIQPIRPIEEIVDPRIETCVAKKEVLVIPHNADVPVPRIVDIVKSANPDQAYVIIHSKCRKDLSHHAPGWGCVYFGIKLPKVSDGVFREPSPDSVEYVAIKRLCKAVVHQSLAQGKKENPYKEIQRMQSIGDNVHILGCIEALQDENYLYIIMPNCEQESLVQWIPWERGLSEEQARVIFRQILENILYLRAHGICHRDLSPDNCMILGGRVVFADLAMSFKAPENGLVTPLGGFGKPAYLPPEVFFNLPFDPYACDLWSSAVILFNLLTGEILYEHPHPSDMLFRYFILARGISLTAVNERTVEVLMELEDAQQSSVWSVASKCMTLDRNVLDLLGGMLHVNAATRWQTEEVQRCAWNQ